MPVEFTPLTEAFVNDHREITRRLSRLLQAVRDGNLPAAREIAAELDRLAGPHIQFEEEVLYPHIARVLGDDYAAQLYREHESGRTVLERLARHESAPAFAPDERHDHQRLLEAAVEHAATCATLLSHLSEVPPAIQAEMHARLLAHRRAALRWTELPTERPGTAADGRTTASTRS